MGESRESGVRISTLRWGDVGAPAGHEVRVWSVSLDSPPLPEGELLACLTPDERERAARYKLPKPRHEFVVGRGCLRTLLGGALGVAPRAVPISYTGAGKPVLADESAGLHFNLTHTAGLALVALAPRPLGIDVERVRAVSNPDGLVDRFFSPAERAAYRTLPDELRPAGFFRGWTCKEAVLKAAALSVMCLEGFDVELHPGRAPAVLAARLPELVERAWELAAWEPQSGFAAAVAVANTPG